jgi:hypothetical protein
MSKSTLNTGKSLTNPDGSNLKKLARKNTQSSFTDYAIHIKKNEPHNKF